MDSTQNPKTNKKPKTHLWFGGFFLLVMMAGLAYVLLVKQDNNIASGSTSIETATSASQDARSALQQVRWASSIEVTYTYDSLIFKSNGIPNHIRQAEYVLPNAGVRVPDASSAKAGPDPTNEQDYQYKLPLIPKKAAKPTATNLGVIGVMISGATLFNPFEGDGTTVAKASNFTVKNASGQDIAFLDSCNGHPTPMGQYHYHALSPCVTAQVDKTDGPSHAIGMAFDGYLIYGDRDVNGKQLSSADLDECNGIDSPTPEHPNGVYHYVLLDTKDKYSSINCLTGEVDSSLSKSADPGMRM